MTIYDSLGYPYTAEMNVQETTTDNQYNITMTDVTDQNGVSIMGAATGAATITFDQATGKITGPTTFNITGLDTDNSEFSDIAVDFSSLTMFSGNTTIEARAGDIDGLDSGNPAGTISGYEISSDGKILGQYTNGSTKLLGQVAIADFDNPAGLRKEGNNLFTATSNSGEFDGIGIDISSNGGAINSGVLEMSNVDLSTEFTEMITTQRGFQANSRIITSSDEMLQELVNLKR
jgi:flagellar hook protein FlgE